MCISHVFRTYLHVSRRNTCIAQIRLRYTRDTLSIHSQYMYSSLVYCAQSDTCNTKRIQCRYMYYDVLRNVTAYMSGDQRCARWMGARECFPSTSGTLAAAGDSPPRAVSIALACVVCCPSLRQAPVHWGGMRASKVAWTKHNKPKLALQKQNLDIGDSIDEEL